MIKPCIFTLSIATLACGSDDAEETSETGVGSSTGTASDTGGDASTSAGSTTASSSTTDTGAETEGESSGSTTGGDAQGDRTLLFINQCAHAVRIGVNGGFIKEVDSCDGDACPEGSSCLASRKPTPACFWDLPEPTQGARLLAPVGQPDDSATFMLDNPALNLPINGTVINVKWSGNVYGAAHCDAMGANCVTGSCSESVMGMSEVVACESGVGPMGPVTLAEFTLSETGVDTYDISQVNGMNLPMSMAPVVEARQSGAGPYDCGAPGSTETSENGALACTWTYDTNIGDKNMASTLRLVTRGGEACTKDDHCVAPQVCGHWFEPGTLNVGQACGTQVGWWNANELCVFTNGEFGAPVGCSDTVPAQGTRTELLGCTGANAGSCYQVGTSDSCCGCPKWVIDGTPLPTDQTCQNTNAAWTGTALPWATFNKTACPTSYAFAFDDATSTFTCDTSAGGAPNATDYVITFCPDGKTGF